MDKSSSSSAKTKLEKFLFKKKSDIQKQDKRKSNVQSQNSSNKKQKIDNYFKSSVSNSTESSKINSAKNQNIVDPSINTNCDSLKDGQDSPIHNLTSNYELKNTSSENDISLLFSH